VPVPTDNDLVLIDAQIEAARQTRADAITHCDLMVEIDADRRINQLLKERWTMVTRP
jgi:hypothetical protein